MLALARFFILGFLVLTVVYVSLSLYSRAVRRDKLEAEWDERPEGDRDAFVRAGLKEYDHSLRRKLILGVYVVPMVLVGIIVYLTNFH
jgi:Ca2+/Na+ antiporter